MPRAAMIAVAVVFLASCAASPGAPEARKPPVYGERPGADVVANEQAFIDSLIFNTAKIQKGSGVTIERRQ